MGWVAVAAAMLVGLAAGFLVGRRSAGAGAAGLVDRRLEGMSRNLDRRLAALDEHLDRGIGTVQATQYQAAEEAAEVRERIAIVEGVAGQLLDQARDLARLEDLLRPPQARGALGELLLEQVLAQGLPAGVWRTQHAFRSGARVDAVLVLGEGLVPVDAKFPLEAFVRMAAAPEGSPARGLHRRAFVRDARRHVDTIAAKYICPAEGTFDFALCYVPSEAVYYEFLREDPPGESTFRYAIERRVFPVSPTTLYAYLISIGLGLRGLRVETNARRMLDALTALVGELDRFRDDFEKVGRHLVDARNRWDEAARRLDRLHGRLDEVTEGAGEPQGGAPVIGEGAGEPPGGVRGTPKGCPDQRGGAPDGPEEGLTGTG